MDVLISIAIGLALRLFISSLDTSLGRLGPVLVGLWEGAVVHYMSTPSLILDHYLAYALRVAVDFYFTSNFLRELIVFLFTILGLVASQTLKPARPRRTVHHRRNSRSSVPTHIRHYVPEPLVSPIRPSRPPTPPSIFLEGQSESNLAHSDNLTRTSTENDDEPFAFSALKHVPPPTPPYTLVSETRANGYVIINRLSTIEEQSSSEEGTRRSIVETNPGALEASHVPSYAPSLTTPLPVPNSTIQYTRTSATMPLEVSIPETAPLPVPNANTKYYTSEDDDDDPLQTPPPPGSVRWQLVTDDDGLTTPPAHELSPLVLESTLLPSFGQALSSTEVPIPNPNATARVTEAAVAQPVPSAVEYPSTSVTPLNPDPAPEPGFDSGPEKPKPGPEASTHTTLVPSLTVEGHNVQHNTNGDSTPDGTRIEEPGQETETETETDAASMISSHPAAVMYSRAEALRNEARAAETEQIRLRKELQNVHGVKVLFLKQQIQEQEDLARRLHGKAAKRFFKARNHLRKRHSYEVDVHGLRVAEAVHQTEQALRDAYTDQAPFVRVIVGKGLHSIGKPVLKDAITRIMDKHGIPCSVDPRNTGVLILTLTPS